MTSLLQKYISFNPKERINFNGGELISDAGLLAYREFDQKLGLPQCFEEYFYMEGDCYRVHTSRAIILQKIYQMLVGYYTDDCADALRYEPLFTEILGKDFLASQSTLSRLNTRLTDATAEQLEKICHILQERIHAYEKPETMILDLDSTHFDTYGNQEKTGFNNHHMSTGYHPLLMYDGMTGDMLKAELRPGNVYTSRDVVAFMKPFLERYDPKHPEINLYVRGDSGFAVPELYDLLEDMAYGYVIRLKSNKALLAQSKHLDDTLMALCKEDRISSKVLYGEIEYQAGSWKKPRRVLVKLEKPTGEFTIHHTFIVSNMSLEPKQILAFYCNRGTMENFIKEGKNGFEFDRMSSTGFVANKNKLRISMLAYNFNN